MTIITATTYGPWCSSSSARVQPPAIVQMPATLARISSKTSAAAPERASLGRARVAGERASGRARL
eukprot:6625552-Prymnesium_polylepis.1